MGWKIVALIGVTISIFILTPLSLFGSFGVGAAWFLFMLPTYGAWIDMGNFKADYTRGGLLKSVYVFLGKKIKNQHVLDFLLLTIRGSYSILIFVLIAFLVQNFLVVLYVIPASFSWASGYAIAWKIQKPNWSEFISGAFLGIWIVVAIIL